MKNSTSGVFDSVTKEVQRFFVSKGVSTIDRVDDLSSGSEMPLDAVKELARASRTGALLDVTIDRPLTKWLKITVACFDSSGLPMWTEDSDAHGITSRKYERIALDRLFAKLNPHLEQLKAQIKSSQEAKIAALMPEHATEATTANPQNPAEPAKDVKLASGTPVRLLVAENLTSKTAKPGDTVKLQVFGDVKVAALVVIANGARAVGTVETAQGAGRAWHSGHLLLKLKTVTLLNQQQQPLQAWRATKGTPTEAAADWTSAVVQSYGLAVFALPFAPLQHGKEAFIRAGTEIQAVTNGDVTLQRAELEGLQGKEEEPRSGPGSVTFYYPTYADNVRQGVWCGKTKIGELRRGGRFVVNLPEGTYWISLLNRRDVPWTKLEIQPGGSQYVRVSVTGVRTGLNKGWLPGLTIVPHDVGELEAVGTVKEKARNVIGANDMDIALLQADPRVKTKRK